MDSQDLDVRPTRLEARHEQTPTLLDGHLKGTDAHLSCHALRQHRSGEQLQQTIEHRATLTATTEEEA